MLEIEGRRVPVTNLEKALYPEAGFTKAQIIDFYIRVSPYLLPHFHDRPITLKRFPDGIHAPAFYEKQRPRFTPDWIQTFPVPRRAGGPDIQYILVNDLATLVWCANSASIELHPFLHRVPEIERPTFVVFDLDPGEGADIRACIEVAFLLKDVLSRLGLESLPKVSGSKGIQVYVPLNTPTTYAATQPFARALAQLLSREHPQLIVAEMAKVERTGKVFIDWSQNSDFKTTVGVYSLRAKRARPFVSMPVDWRELERAAKSGKTDGLYFEPEPALKRLSEIGDLFGPVLTLEQSLPDRPVAELLAEGPARVTASKRVSSQRAAKRSAAPAADLDQLPQSAMQFIEPMQCKLAAELPEGDDWQYEIKLDGYRALGIKDGKAHLLSRRNNALNGRFPPIAKALETIEDGVILDGEIVALDEHGRPSFNRLQHYKTADTLVYYVFDLLAYRRRDLRNLPLRQRRELLDAVLADAAEPIRISAILQASAQDLIAAASEQGLEGIIAKRGNARYESGERSGSWVKYKVNRGQELVIGGYKPGGKNHFENLAVGYYDRDRLIFIAKLKNGFTPAAKDEIFARFGPLETKTCPFANLPEPKNARRGEALTAEAMKKYRWLRPELVAQVEFTEWTAALTCASYCTSFSAA